MRKLRGPLLEVTPLRREEHQLGGWIIDRIRIGKRTLTTVSCDDMAAQELRADGDREVCLYVLRLPTGLFAFPFTKTLLGMKYLDTGKKHLIPFSFARNSCIRYAVISALVWPLVWGVSGAIVTSVLGVYGIVTSETIVAGIPGLLFFGGLILAWGSSLRLGVDWVRARID